MFATVRSYAGDRDLADALVDRADDVKRIVSDIAGFHAYYLIQTDGGTVSVTVYDNQAGAEESNRAAAEWLRENLPDLQTGAPQVSAGEVVITA